MLFMRIEEKVPARAVGRRWGAWVLPRGPWVGLCWGLVLGLVGCGDEGGSSGGAAGTGVGGGSGGGGSGGGGSAGKAGSSGSTGGGGEASSPWSGEGLRQGWKKAFSKESAGLNCTMSAAEVEASSATRLTFGTSTLFVGFQQIGNNQDPVFIRVDAGEKVYCEHHEKEPPDGRALGLAWDGGATAYVIYTVVGGGTVFDQKAKTRWLDRYGDGGGSSKASFLGEVDVASGDLRHGTFIIAKKKDGKTNTHNPADAPIPREDGRIEFLGDSAFQPMNPDKTIMECTGYPFFTRYIFSSDLTTLTCSSSTSCTAKSPCEEE